MDLSQVSAVQCLETRTVHEAENPPDEREGVVFNGNQFIINCNEYPPEELARYAGQYVAWSMDGKAILGHAAELLDLDREMKKRGIDEYVSEWIFPPDMVCLGSAELWTADLEDPVPDSSSG